MWNRLRALMSSNEPGWGRSTPPGNTPSSGPPPADGSGRPPQRPPEGPPDLDELWKDFSRKLNALLGGKGGGQPPSRGGGGDRPPLSGRGMLTGSVVLAVVAALLWLGSGFHIVPEGQSAVVMRFGKFQSMTDRAGFQWRMPWPIESHELVDGQQLRQVEVGYRGNVKNKVPKESLILTGDQAIIDMQFALQYRLADPRKFLFENNMSPSPEELIRQASESAMREIVGQSKIDQVLYEEKAKVAEDAQQLTQRILDRYDMGVAVVNLTVQQTQPPEQVQSAFEDANKAAQDRQRLINEGQAYANDVVPRATGAASRLRLEAEGYRSKVVASAEGDASRFSQVLTQYEKAPAVTRERLYLDTMQGIFASTSKVYMDSRAGNNLLYLPLDRLLKEGKAAPAEPDLSNTTDAINASGRPRSADTTTAPERAQTPAEPRSLRSRDRDAAR